MKLKRERRVQVCKEKDGGEGRGGDGVEKENGVEFHV